MSGEMILVCNSVNGQSLPLQGDRGVASPSRDDLLLVDLIRCHEIAECQSAGREEARSRVLPRKGLGHDGINLSIASGQVGMTTAALHARSVKAAVCWRLERLSPYICSIKVDPSRIHNANPAMVKIAILYILSYSPHQQACPSISKSAATTLLLHSIP